MEKTVRLFLTRLLLGLILVSSFAIHCVGVTSTRFKFSTTQVRSFSRYVFTLGNVTSTYLQDVYVPVYVNGGSGIANLTQVFSYDPGLLAFSGVVGDVASENVSFTTKTLANGVLWVSGGGNFTVLPYTTTLYYLVFTPLLSEQVSTMVLLDYSVVGGLYDNQTAASYIKLARGWTLYGPNTVPMHFGWLNGASMVTNGTGFTNAIGFSPYYPNIIYAGSGSPGNFGITWAYGGIMKSTDGGRTWRLVDLGLSFTNIQYIWVDPDNPNTVVVIANNWGSAGGVFKTTNGGESWQETYYGAGDMLQYVEGKGLYAILYHAVLLSTDMGTTWSVVSTTTNTIDAGVVLSGGETIELAEDNFADHTMHIYISTNGGQSYSECNQSFTLPNVLDLAVDPSNSSIQWMLHLAGYTNPSVYKSVDGGLTWQVETYASLGMTSFTEPDFNPQVIAYDPANSSVMYIGGEVYVAKSVNGGETFQQLKSIVTSPYRIVVDPLNDSNVYVGGENGLFVSHDGGKTWYPLNNRPVAVITGIAVDGENAAATIENFAEIMSTDNGSNWTLLTPRPTGPGGSTLRWEGGVAVVDPYNNSIVLVAAGGMVVSYNGGMSFQLPNIDQVEVDNFWVSEMHAFWFLPGSHTIFYAGGAGIFVSYDGGHDWTLLPDSPRYCGAIDGFVGSNGYTLYAANSSGLYVSDDGGDSWQLLNTDNFETISVDPGNPNIIAATVNTQVLISYDGGRDFTPTGESSHYYGWGASVLFYTLPNDSVALLYVSMSGLSISLDYGATWVNLDYNLPTQALTSLEIYGNTSYVTTAGASVWFDPDLFNPYYYMDNPLLTGYLPPGHIVSVNGQTISGAGYFTVKLNTGTNTIVYEGKTYYLEASRGEVYFYNMSSLQSTLTPEHYTVKFVESGLPQGAAWHVNLSSGQSNTTTSDTITFSLPNGTYTYTVGAEVAGYTPTPRSGTFTVAGGPVTVSVEWRQNTPTATTTVTATTTSSTSTPTATATTTTTTTSSVAPTTTTTSETTTMTTTPPQPSSTSGGTRATPPAGSGAPTTYLVVAAVVVIVVVAAYILAGRRR